MSSSTKLNVEELTIAKLLDFSIDSDRASELGGTETATLLQVLHACGKTSNRIISASNLPLCDHGTRPSVVSTEYFAWRATEEYTHGTTDNNYPLSAVCKAHVHSKYCLTAWVQNTGGQGSDSMVHCGVIVVFLAKPSSRSGTISHLDELSPRYDEPFHPLNTNTSIWDIEAVLLQAGDQMYVTRLYTYIVTELNLGSLIRPGVPYAYYTVQHAITVIQHYICVSTMDMSLVNMVQTFAHPFDNDNDYPYHVWDLLFRIVFFNHLILVKGKSVHDHHSSAHVVRLTDLPSFIKLLSAVSLILFSNVLNPLSYICPPGTPECSRGATIRLMEYDLNSLSGYERSRRVFMRSLAWETIRHVCDYFQFTHSGYSQEMEPFKDIVVPFPANISLSISTIYSLSFNKGMRLYDENMVALQALSPLRKEPIIMHHIASNRAASIEFIIPDHSTSLVLKKCDEPKKERTQIFGLYFDSVSRCRPNHLLLSRY